MCHLTTKIRKDVKWTILVRKLLLMTSLYSIFLLKKPVFVKAGTFDDLFVIKEKSSLSCDIIEEESYFKADCSDQNYGLEVPQSLEKLKVLNLSRNYAKNVTRQSFEKYKDTLTILDMSHMTRLTENGLEFSTDSFYPLHKLEYLDLSESCYKKNFYIPKKIRVLKIENCSTTIEVSDLNNLEEFHAAGNSWTNCPKFHPLAPLRYIDLRRNELLQFDIERIAPLCHLRTLRLNTYIPDDSYPSTVHNFTTYCACMALEAWLTNIKISHGPLICTLPDDYMGVCDQQVKEQALELRQQCLVKVTPEIVTSIETNWLLILMIVLVFIFIALPFLANLGVDYIRRREERKKRKAKAKEEEIEEEQIDEEREEEEVVEEEEHESENLPES